MSLAGAKPFVVWPIDREHIGIYVGTWLYLPGRTTEDLFTSIAQQRLALFDRMREHRQAIQRCEDQLRDLARADRAVLVYQQVVQGRRRDEPDRQQTQSQTGSE